MNDNEYIDLFMAKLKVTLETFEKTFLSQNDQNCKELKMEVENLIIWTKENGNKFLPFPKQWRLEDMQDLIQPKIMKFYESRVNRSINTEFDDCVDLFTNFFSSFIPKPSL
jgi:hypothetical protein